MSDEPTQACTLAIEHTEDDENEVESDNKGWGILKSLNPAYPDFKLVVDESSFGRHPNSTFHFNDKNISGTHCIIKKEPQSNKSDPIIAFIHDQSTNGTFVDGQKIGKGNRHLLVKDQEISLTVIKSKTAGERISFIYRPIERDDEEDGGPQKKYLVGETLGSGNFATVKLAVDRKTGEKYAIKIIDKKKYFMNSSNRKDALMDEVNILKGLNHGNIIHIQEVFDTEKTLYLVLELVKGGELLNDILNSAFYAESKARLLFRQIANGVQYLHERGIAHRDLKPENILLKEKGDDLDPTDNNSIKLSDFGLSRTINEGSMMTTMCGTPQYLAPEIIMGTNKGGYGKEVDCWSMGGILYVMLCGYPPFDESKDTSIFELIRNAIFDFPDEDWSQVSDEAKDLIKRLLNSNPSKRFNCQQILNHPWLNPNNSLKSLLDSELPSSQKQQSSLQTPPLEKSNSVLGKRKSDDSLFSDENLFSTSGSNVGIDNEVATKKLKISKEHDDDQDTDEEVTTNSSFKSNSSLNNTNNNKGSNNNMGSLFNNTNNNNNNNNIKSSHNTDNNSNVGSLFNNTNNNKVSHYNTDNNNDNDDNSNNNNNNYSSNTNNNNAGSIFNTNNKASHYTDNNSNTGSLFNSTSNNNKYYSSNDDNDDNDNDNDDNDNDNDNNDNDNKSDNSTSLFSNTISPPQPKPSHYPVPSNSSNSPNKSTTPPTTSSNTNTGAVDNRPMCKYGHSCYRKNPSHFKEYRHPI